MDYLDYESTLPDMKRTFYSGFKFYSMDKVQDLIKNIPETRYGQYPEGIEPESESTTTSSGSSRLSPAEVARMNKVQAAKTLLKGDTRKAQANLWFCQDYVYEGYGSHNWLVYSELLVWSLASPDQQFRFHVQSRFWWTLQSFGS